VAAAIVAVALVAGCSSSADKVSTGSPAAGAQLVKYTQATEKTKTATFTLETKMSGSITKDAPAKSLSFSGHGAIDFENEAISMTIDAAGQSIEERLVDGFLYLKLPEGLAGKFGSDKPWVKLSLSQMGGIGTDPSGTGIGNDPGALLDQLKSVSSKVTSKPGPQVNGQPTTEYDADIDLQKVVAKAPNAASQKVLDKLGLKSIPVQVFVDGQNRVVRISESMELGMGTMEMTLTFSDFGQPVDITAPPADQTTDFKSLMGSFGSNVNELSS
jgi:hypothetical protein